MKSFNETKKAHGFVPQNSPDFLFNCTLKMKDRVVVDLTKEVCGFIIGEATSAEEAQKLAGTMRNCPYLVASGTTANMIYSIYIVPKEKRWWLKYPETNPKETV